jgi:hypothetical protein
MTEEDMLKEACKPECVDNNDGGVNCYEHCDACGEGIDRCPQECLDNCADCVCCFCEVIEEPGLKDMICNISAEVNSLVGQDCAASEPWIVEEPENCTYVWVCENYDTPSWCRWDCDLRASEE